MIRRAVDHDLEAVLAIEESSPTAAHWTQAQYDAAIHQRERLFLVVELESSIVGFLVAFIAAPEWELENIAVRPTARRRGIGQELIKAMILEAEGAGATEIRQEIRASNHGAQALGQKMGFVEQGRRRAYYRNPDEDALLFKYLVSNRPGRGKSRQRQLRKDC
jgi:[ribosomal protein S18]-alanine N-acetyltransferase